MLVVKEGGVIWWFCTWKGSKYWYFCPDWLYNLTNPINLIIMTGVQMLYGCRPYGEGQSQERVWADGIIANAGEVVFPAVPKVRTC